MAALALGCVSVTALRRHRLVWLGADAWRRVLEPTSDAAPWDAQALECLSHWAEHDLPLVVTRQPPTWSGHRGDEPLALGLAASERWGRRRLFVEVSASAVRRVGEFAGVDAIAGTVPTHALEGFRALCAGFDRLRVAVRVYGSYGWQQLTGLAYVHEHSDIDLLATVETPPQADAVVALLQRVPFDAPRVDGEIVFGDATAIAWREWAAWRSGQVERVLVKRLCGAALEDAQTWAVRR